MPDLAQVANAQALEVPVVVQGAKDTDGTGRRELFTENATTVLVLENGAVLNLRSKLTVGQVLFIQNTQNGKEVLTNVMETPPQGQVGQTHLEFAAPSPGFWNAAVEPPAASAPHPEPPPPAAPRREEPSGNLHAMMSSTDSVVVPSKPFREELVPAHEEVPVPEALVSNESESAPDATMPVPTGEEIDAALLKLSPMPYTLSASAVAGATVQEQDVPERAPRSVAPQRALPGEPSAQAGTGASAARKKLSLSDRLAAGKNAKIVAIAASVGVALAIGFMGYTMRGMFFHRRGPSAAASASAARPKQIVPPIPPPAASTPPVGAPANALKPAAAQARVPAALTPKVLAAAPAVVAAKPHSDPVAPARLAVSKHSNADSGDSSSDAVPPISVKLGEKTSAADAPAKILYQPQPAFPSWAKKLDVVAGAVTLDALIDENGNVAEISVLSGPRALQHSAEEAIDLWQFAPAESGGKPIASHMVLTVKFRR